VVKKNYTAKVKDYFDFGKTEQKGIVTLLFLILFVVSINFLLPYFLKSNQYEINSYIKDIESFRKSIIENGDSLQLKHQAVDYNDVDRSIAEHTLHPVPFNPNNLPEEKWAQIGLTNKQIRTIKNFEEKGGKFYKKEDLRKIYGISEADFRALEPYIEIPMQQYDKKKYEIKEQKAPQKIVEINSADSAQLIDISGIGPFFARRIIKYRDRLGGFIAKEQLLEVYGMDSTRYLKIIPFISVNTLQIRKTDLNTATFKDLMKNPYIDFYLAGAIIKYRNKNGKFSSLGELMKVSLVYDEVYRKISPYLTVN
jgi:competence protein ComEA